MPIPRLFKKLILVWLFAFTSVVKAEISGPSNDDPWYLTGYLLGWMSSCSNTKYSEIKTLRDRVKDLSSNGRVTAIEFDKYKRGWGQTSATEASGCSSSKSKTLLNRIDKFLDKAELASVDVNVETESVKTNPSISDEDCEALGMSRKMIDEIYISAKYDAAYKARIIKEITENRAKQLCFDKYKGNRSSLN